jgi:ADP-heptose:LPS heptosyltransferase
MINIDNLQRFGLMRPYVSGQANIYPPKRIKQLRRLLETQSPNICVIRGEGMGDVLMTTPTLDALKKIFPSTPTITYATNTRYLNGGLVKVLQGNPSIDKIIDRDQVDESEYDLTINLHCPCVAYEKKENPPINRIDLFAAHAGVKLENKTPRYFLQPEEVEAGISFLRANRIKSKVIMVHIFTTTARRNLNSTMFKSTLMDLTSRGYSLLILSHSSDYPSDVLFDNIPGAHILKDQDIRTIAGIMVSCDLVICPDSAILHLAGALGVPTVSLFGHTDPRARINYYPNAVAIWPGERAACAPCWSGPCSFKHACYTAITKEMILEAVDQKLGLSQSNPVQLSNRISVERI